LVELRPEAVTSTSLALLPISLTAELVSLSDIGDAVLKLADLSNYMNLNSQFSSFWYDNMVFFQQFLPVAHDVLSLSRMDPTGCDLLPTQVLREAIRLALNVYLALVRRFFGIVFDCVSTCRMRLLQALGKYAIDWSSFQSLHMWTFVILGIADVAACPAWAVAHVSHAMDKLELRDWPDAVNHLREICWCDKLCQDDLQLLGSRVMNSYNSVQESEI
jgi:hypothetical protein